MNLPNTLTVSRLSAAMLLMVIMALPFPFSTTLSLLLFVAASITDYYDGHLARTVYGTTAFGKLMDPLADKVLVCAALIGFVGVRLPNEPLYSLVPAWVVVVIIAREFAVTGLRLLAAADAERRIISAGSWGKLKTVGQMTAIITTFVLLAVREDILPLFPKIPDTWLKIYDSAFLWTSWTLSAIVVLLTLFSGWKYFSAHLDLVTREM